MGGALEQHTVLPPAAHDPLLERARELLNNHQQVALNNPSGTSVVLPDEVYRVLHDVVEAMSQGLAVTVAPRNTQLTTQEAADVLGISRPTLVRLLEEGKIPFKMRGKHRRVLLADLVEYDKRAKIEREAALDEMARESAADGSLFATTQFVRTR